LTPALLLSAWELQVAL